MIAGSAGRGRAGENAILMLLRFGVAHGEPHPVTPSVEQIITLLVVRQLVGYDRFASMLSSAASMPYSLALHTRSRRPSAMKPMTTKKPVVGSGMIFAAPQPPSNSSPEGVKRVA